MTMPPSVKKKTVSSQKVSQQLHLLLISLGGGQASALNVKGCDTREAQSLLRRGPVLTGEEVVEAALAGALCRGWVKVQEVAKEWETYRKKSDFCMVASEE